MDGRTHGRRQNYIPPTSSGDNKAKSLNGYPTIKVYFREMFKSQNINLISPTPKFSLGIIHTILVLIQIKVYTYLTGTISISDLPRVRSVCKVKVFFLICWSILLSL